MPPKTRVAVVPIGSVEPGMTLAGPVLSSSGQTLMTSGTTLEMTHIEFLKKRGIQKVQITTAEFAAADADVYKRTIDSLAASAGPDSVDVSNIDPGGPTVVLNQMPVDSPPADSPTAKQVRTEQIEKTNRDWQARRVARQKTMVEKHGEKYQKVVQALGDPQSVSPTAAFQPAKLFTSTAKDLTEHIFLEKKLNTDTLDILTQNITTEIITRQGMATLLARAQAAGQYLLAHMVNVGVYSMYLGIKMEMSSEEIRDISIGGMLADIGMLSLPDQFWKQDRSLWDKEEKHLRSHPDAGYRMILDTAGARDSWARLALEHHERLDGTGYPKGLSAKEIGLPSRMVQICDVYSAATADRAYRDANLPDTAIRQMMGKPNLYDRAILELFCQLVGFYPEGFIVLLSSGEHAVVVTTNSKNVFRPVVRLRKDKGGRPLMPQEQVIVDLTSRPDLRIIKILEDDTIRWV